MPPSIAEALPKRLRSLARRRAVAEQKGLSSSNDAVRVFRNARILRGLAAVCGVGLARIFGVALGDWFDCADQLLLRIQIIEQPQPPLR